VVDVLQEKELHLRTPLEEVELILDERRRRREAELLRATEDDAGAIREEESASRRAPRGGNTARAAEKAAVVPARSYLDATAAANKGEIATDSSIEGDSRPAVTMSLPDSVVAAYDVLPDYEDIE